MNLSTEKLIGIKFSLNKKNIFALLTLLVGIVSYIWVFIFTPIEINQGFVQKILYIHVPAILAAYLALLILFISSWGYLIMKKEIYDYLNIAFSEIAVIMLLISLVTGAIWGKPTWNTYWTWDARLTITLITFIYFSAYLLYSKLAGINIKAKKGAAILAIFGFFAVPLNHLAVNWFNSLHQSTTIFRAKPLIDDELLNPLLLCSIFYLLLIISLSLFRIDLEKQKRNYIKELIN